MGISLTPEERFEVFGEHDQATVRRGGRQRWGETDARAVQADALRPTRRSTGLDQGRG